MVFIFVFTQLIKQRNFSRCQEKCFQLNIGKTTTTLGESSRSPLTPSPLTGGVSGYIPWSQKAKQHLYHQILRTFYNAVVEKSPKTSPRCLQRVVRAEGCSTGLAPPCLRDVYTRRCTIRGTRIIRDPFHASNDLFQLLRPGTRDTRMMAKTKRRRRSF